MAQVTEQPTCLAAQVHQASDAAPVYPGMYPEMAPPGFYPEMAPPGFYPDMACQIPQQRLIIQQMFTGSLNSVHPGFEFLPRKMT